MRRYSLIPGTYHHIVVRGTRGLDIFHDEQDWWEMLRLLFLLNDTFHHSNWKREVERMKLGPLERPDHWPAQDALVTILSYCIHNNHIHLLLKEHRESGISQFMSRIEKVLSTRYNKKYGGSGSIFQGPYKQRHISTDSDIHNVFLYITAKNVMERYPHGGLSNACKNFEDAYAWALKDPFSSFPDYAANRQSPIISKDILQEHFKTTRIFKKECFEYIKEYTHRDEQLGDLALE